MFMLDTWNNKPKRYQYYIILTCISLILKIIRREYRIKKEDF